MRVAGRGEPGVGFEYQATLDEPGLYITNKAAPSRSTASTGVRKPNKSALTGKTFTRHLFNSDKPSLPGIRERSRQAVIQADRGIESEQLTGFTD